MKNSKLLNIIKYLFDLEKKITISKEFEYSLSKNEVFLLYILNANPGVTRYFLSKEYNLSEQKISYILSNLTKYDLVTKNKKVKNNRIIKELHLSSVGVEIIKQIETLFQEELINPTIFISTH